MVEQFLIGAIFQQKGSGYKSFQKMKSPIEIRISGIEDSTK